MLRGSWRRCQQVREEVTGKLVPVEFELYSVGYYTRVTHIEQRSLPVTVNLSPDIVNKSR